MLSLSFHLFSCPTCCIDGSRSEVARGSGFFDELGDPFLSVVVRQRSVGECFAEITRLKLEEFGSRRALYSRNDAHASSKEAFIVIHVLGNCLEEFKYGLDVGLKHVNCHSVSVGPMYCSGSHIPFSVLLNARISPDQASAIPDRRETM
jgi:hypothetical protein